MEEAAELLGSRDCVFIVTSNGSTADEAVQTGQSHLAKMAQQGGRSCSVYASVDDALEAIVTARTFTQGSVCEAANGPYKYHFYPPGSPTPDPLCRPTIFSLGDLVLVWHHGHPYKARIEEMIGTDLASGPLFDMAWCHPNGDPWAFKTDPVPVGALIRRLSQDEFSTEMIHEIVLGSSPVPLVSTNKLKPSGSKGDKGARTPDPTNRELFPGHESVPKVKHMVHKIESKGASRPEVPEAYEERRSSFSKFSGTPGSDDDSSGVLTPGVDARANDEALAKVEAKAAFEHNAQQEKHEAEKESLRRAHRQAVEEVDAKNEAEMRRLQLQLEEAESQYALHNERNEELEAKLGQLEGGKVDSEENLKELAELRSFRDRMAQLEDLHEKTLEEHTAQSEAQRKEFEERVTTLSEESASTENLLELREKYEQEFHDQQAEMQLIQAKLDNATKAVMAVAAAASDSPGDDMQASSPRSVAATAAGLVRNLQKNKRQAASQLAATKAELDRANRALESKTKEVAEARRLKELQAGELAKLKMSAARYAKDIREQEAKMAAQELEHESHLEELATQHKAALATLQQEHEATVERLEAEERQDSLLLEEETTKKLEEAHARLAESESEAATKVEAANALLVESESEVKAKTSELLTKSSELLHAQRALDEARTAHDDWLKDAGAKHAKHATTVLALETEHAKQKAAIEEEHREALAKIEREQAQAHETALAINSTMRKEHDAVVLSKTRELGEIRDAMQRKEQEHSAALADVEDAHKSALAGVEEAHKSALAGAEEALALTTQQHSGNLQRKEEEHFAALAGAEASTAELHAKRMQEVESTHEEKLREMQREHECKLLQLQADEEAKTRARAEKRVKFKENMTAQHEAELQTLKQDHNTQLEEAKVQLRQHRTELEEMSSDLLSKSNDLKEMQTAHTERLSGVEASFRESMEEGKQQHEEALVAANATHSTKTAHMEALEAEHKKHQESLVEAHGKEVAAIKEEYTTKHDAGLADLRAEHEVNVPATLPCYRYTNPTARPPGHPARRAPLNRTPPRAASLHPTSSTLCDSKRSRSLRKQRAWKLRSERKRRERNSRTPKLGRRHIRPRWKTKWAKFKP